MRNDLETLAQLNSFEGWGGVGNNGASFSSPPPSHLMTKPLDLSLIFHVSRFGVFVEG